MPPENINDFFSPVSTGTNPHQQIDDLILMSELDKIAKENMMYGAMTQFNPEDWTHGTGGLGLLEWADTGPIVGMKALAGLVGKGGKKGKVVKDFLKDIGKSSNKFFREFGENAGLSGVELEKKIHSEIVKKHGTDPTITLYRGVQTPYKTKPFTEYTEGEIGKWWTTDIDRAEEFAKRTGTGELYKVEVPLSKLSNQELALAGSENDFQLGIELQIGASLLETKGLSKLQKTAKEGVEEMVTLYRGYDQWYPGNMVKEGKFMSPGQGRKGIYVTNNKEWVKEAGYLDPHWPSMPRVSKGSGNPSILEFEVPKSWFDKAKKTEKYGTVHLSKGTGTKERINAQVGEFYIEGGIPVKFLKKRHR